MWTVWRVFAGVRRAARAVPFAQGMDSVTLGVTLAVTGVTLGVIGVNLGVIPVVTIGADAIKARCWAAAVSGRVRRRED